MDKFVYFGTREEIIECDIDVTYQDFLAKIQETFNLEDDTFSVLDLTESDFDKMMTINDRFVIGRSEKYFAKERLNDKILFEEIDTVQEAEDFLLVYGNIIDCTESTLLHKAACRGNEEMVKLILEKEYNDVHRVNIFGETPTDLAVSNSHIGVVKILLEQNFDNTHEDNLNRIYPLNRAKYDGYDEIVKILEEDIARRERVNK